MRDSAAELNGGGAPDAPPVAAKGEKRCGDTRRDRTRTERERVREREEGLIRRASVVDTRHKGAPGMGFVFPEMETGGGL